MNKYTLGNRIADTRIKNGMKAYELADRLGIAGTTMSFYENGKTLPRADMLVDIAKIFNVSIDYLCGLTEETK